MLAGLVAALLAFYAVFDKRDTPGFPATGGIGNASVADVLARWQLMLPVKHRLSSQFSDWPGSFADRAGRNETKYVQMSRDILESGVLSVVSVVVDDADLFDPDTGILVQGRKRMRSEVGSIDRKWERLAYFSIHQFGQQRFSSLAGIRPHGNIQRYHSAAAFQQDECRYSGHDFRLYARRAYGRSTFPKGVILDSGARSARTLVVRAKQAIRNILAYRIAQRIGAAVPAAELVRFYLNGKDLCLAVLSEHLGRRQLEYELGRDVVVYKYKKRDNEPNAASTHKQLEKLDPSLISMDAIVSILDVNNLTRHLLASMVMGNRDWDQGVGLKTSAEAPWAWIIWDMDTTFRKIDAGLNPVELILRKRNVRSSLLKGLLKDPGYVEWFLSLVTEQLNHRLDRDSIADVVAPYLVMFDEGSRHREEVEKIAAWMYARPEFLFRQFRDSLSPESELVSVHVQGGEKFEFEVDGYPQRSSYKGEYFSGQSIVVSLPEDGRHNVKFWLVNGKRLEPESLRLPLSSDVRIRAVAHD